MPTREEMRSLAQDMVRSYEDRVSGIAQIKSDTSAMLQEFAKGDAERKADVSAMLKGFDRDHAAMSKEMRAELARGRKDLAQEEKQRQSEAREFLGEGKAEVNARLADFDSAHNAMSKQLKADLAKEERERRSQARAFMGELARVVAEGKAATQARLKEFADEQAGAHDEWLKLGATMQAKRGGSKAKKATPPPLTPEETEEA